VLAGWLLPAKRRAREDLAFRVLRDADGDTQLVLRGNIEEKDLMNERAQSVLCVEGVVRARGEGRENEVSRSAEGLRTGRAGARR
jgi:aspartyl-tRNA synthetase